MSGITEIAVVAAVVGSVIATQVRGQVLRAKRLLMLPVVLIVIGLVRLHGMIGVSSADIACITVSAVIAVAIGVAQGAITRLESRDGMLWGRLPVWGLWFWVALIVSRVVMILIAHAIGAEAAASTDSVLVTLGINRLAQGGAIAGRAVRAGLPLTLTGPSE
jgi:hypothetical protein